MLNITTNHVPRDVVDGFSVPQSVRVEFDYVDWAGVEDGTSGASFIKYRGEWYDLNDFMRTTDLGVSAELRGWDGYVSDSFATGIVVRYADESCETVIMGRYWACDCDENDGPCAMHSEEIVQRAGSSNRSADELVHVFIDDARDILTAAGKPMPDDDGLAVVLADVNAWDGSWLADPEAAEWARHYADYMVTHALSTIGLSVSWDDGYRIYRLTGGPLL